MLRKRKDFTSWKNSHTARMGAPQRLSGWRYALEFPWRREHFVLGGKFLLLVISAMVSE